MLSKSTSSDSKITRLTRLIVPHASFCDLAFIESSVVWDWTWFGLRPCTEESFFISTCPSSQSESWWVLNLQFLYFSGQSLIWIPLIFVLPFYDHDVSPNRYLSHRNSVYNVCPVHMSGSNCLAWHLNQLPTITNTVFTKNKFLNPQRTFARYTERTAFERPLTSGVAYAVRVLHSERAEFEKQHGWPIRRMDTPEQNPVHKNDFNPEVLEPSPIQEEYAPVIFAQDTISHVVSLDMLSGKVNSFLSCYE